MCLATLFNFSVEFPDIKGVYLQSGPVKCKSSSGRLEKFLFGTIHCGDSKHYRTGYDKQRDNGRREKKAGWCSKDSVT